MKQLLILGLFLLISLPIAAKEKEKSTNPLSRLSTLTPQLLPRNPSNKPPPSPVQKQLDAFFQGVQAAKLEESFRALVASNPALSQPDAIPEFVESIRKGLEIYGPLQGVELYDQRPVGTRVLYLTYISFHTQKPLRWQFVYYLPVGTDWKILNFRFDDSVDQSLIPD